VIYGEQIQHDVIIAMENWHLAQAEFKHIRRTIHHQDMDNGSDAIATVHGIEADLAKTEVCRVLPESSFAPIRMHGEKPLAGSCSASNTCALQ